MSAISLELETAGSLRDRVLDATERLLARWGYQKTTMEDLAREAGVAKRSIYLHFGSKDGVALASIDRIVARLVERLRALAASDLPVADKLRQMLITRVLFRFDSVRDYYHSLDDLFVSLRPAYMARRERWFQAEAAVFAEVLQKVCKHPVEVAKSLLLATNALLPYSLTAKELGRRGEVEKKAARLADLLVRGVNSLPRSVSRRRAKAPRRGA
jgi:AcrR family transcriptional regulator